MFFSQKPQVALQHKSNNPPATQVDEQAAIIAQLRNAKCNDPLVNQQLQEILNKIQAFTSPTSNQSSQQQQHTDYGNEYDQEIDQSPSAKGAFNESFALTPVKPSSGKQQFNTRERDQYTSTSPTPSRHVNNPQNKNNSYLVKQMNIQRSNSSSKFVNQISPNHRDSPNQQFYATASDDSSAMGATTAATTASKTADYYSQSSQKKLTTTFYSNTTSATPKKLGSSRSSQRFMQTHQPSLGNSSTPSKLTPSRHNSKSNSNLTSHMDGGTSQGSSYQSIYSNYQSNQQARNNLYTPANNSKSNLPSHSPIRGVGTGTITTTNTTNVPNFIEPNMAAIKSWIASHENRFASLLNGTQIDAVETQGCTFHPNLDLTRGYVSQKNRGPGGVVDRLYDDQKQRRQAHLQEQHQLERQAKELEECTFKPEINPELNRNKENVNSEGEVRGFEGAVDRLRGGFSKSQKKFEEITKIRRGSLFERNKQRQFNPPSMLLRNANVFYTAKITLANGVTQKKISMSEDDDPVELAKRFALANKLSQKEHSILEKTLVEQFKAHLLNLIQYASESNQL